MDDEVESLLDALASIAVPIPINGKFSTQTAGSPLPSAVIVSNLPLQNASYHAITHEQHAYPRMFSYRVLSHAVIHAR
jgi:hypothetical protein